MGIQANRWRGLLLEDGKKVKFRTFYAYIALGYFFNNLLPGGFGGDAVKTISFGKFNPKIASLQEHWETQGKKIDELLKTGYSETHPKVQTQIKARAETEKLLDQDGDGQLGLGDAMGLLGGFLKK